MHGSGIWICPMADWIINIQNLPSMPLIIVFHNCQNCTIEKEHVFFIILWIRIPGIDGAEALEKKINVKYLIIFIMAKVHRHLYTNYIDQDLNITIILIITVFL